MKANHHQTNEEEWPTIKFDRPMLERLRLKHAQAKRAKETVFVFEEREYLVSYAGYLIEYLDSQLPKINGKIKHKKGQ